MLLLTAHTVATLLVGLGGLITTNVAEKGVVGEGADDFDRGEHVGCVEKEREREVNQGIAEVAFQRLVCGMT